VRKAHSQFTNAYRKWEKGSVEPISRGEGQGGKKRALYFDRKKPLISLRVTRKKGCPGKSKNKEGKEEEAFPPSRKESSLGSFIEKGEKGKRIDRLPKKKRSRSPISSLGLHGGEKTPKCGRK